MTLHAGRIAIVVLALLRLSGVAAAQTTFKFDFEVSPSLPLPATPDGLIPLRLIYQKKVEDPLPEKVDVSVAQFLSEAGALKAMISVGKCDPKHAPSVETVHFKMPEGSLQDLCLSLKNVPPGSKYSGNLVVQSEKTEPLVKTLGVQRSAPPPTPGPPSIVVTGPDKVVVTSAKTAQFDILIQEKTGKTPVEGLYAKLEVAKSPMGFDPKSVSFKIAEVEEDLFTAAATDDNPRRRITAFLPTKIRVTLNNLEAGEYNLVFRFAGSNLAVDESQKATVPVYVRDHWIYAVIVLLLASLLSFLANKVVAGRRKALDLLQRIVDLRPAWLGRFGPISPVVWVRAMLSQAEKLSSTSWLTSPDIIEGRLNAVKNVIKILDEARRLADRLDGLSFLVKRKVLPELNRLIDRVGAGPMDDTAVAKFEADLAMFEDWLDPAKFPQKLWGGVQSRIQDLLATIAQATTQGLGGQPPLQIPANASPVFTQLITTLSNAAATAPTTRLAVENAYSDFARLHVLWDVLSKDPSVLPQCIAALSNLRALFDIADRSTWGRLSGQQLKIRIPTSTDPWGLQAFAPLQFSVVGNNLPSDEDYLFHYRIQYRWIFLTKPKHLAFWRSKKEMSLQPLTLNPLVTQFFTHRGTVNVSVEMDFLGQTHRIHHPRGQVLTIGSSQDFRIFRGFERTELLSWFIALLIAIASGLSIYYVGSNGWGTFKDYLTLFLWGAGMEQGKTFLQAASK